MKLFFRFLTLILFILPITALAISPDNEMNPGLYKIFDYLISAQASSGIFNKEFTISLKLKFASDRHLIFSDAYVKLNQDEKYQIAKWKFNPALTKGLSGRKDIVCKVTFLVKAINKTGAYINIPHIVAEVKSIDASD